MKIVTSSFKNSKDPLITSSNVEVNQYDGPFKNIDSMYDVLFTIDNLGGWINDISFQNNGSSLVVIPHHNHIKVFDVAENQKVIVG